jgi:hypothetical protein
MVEEIIIPEILERISDEVHSLRSIRCPYDAQKTCVWNFSLVVRLQIQLIKTLRDRVSRLIAAAENQFRLLFIGEILRGELLPMVRIHLNDPSFLVSIAKKSFKNSILPKYLEEEIANSVFSLEEKEFSEILEEESEEW